MKLSHKQINQLRKYAKKSRYFFKALTGCTKRVLKKLFDMGIKDLTTPENRELYDDLMHEELKRTGMIKIASVNNEYT